MGPSTGSRKLAGIEHALRFIDDLAPFNVVIVLSIEGDLRDAGLRPALDELQHRHPLLQARIVTADKGYSFQFGSSGPIPVEVREAPCTDSWIAAAEKELHRRLDLAAGPLMRCQYLRGQSGGHLIVVIHHCIIDAPSGLRLLRELLSLCAGQAIDDGAAAQEGKTPIPALYPLRYTGSGFVRASAAFMGRQAMDEMRFRWNSRGVRRPPIAAEGRCRILPFRFPAETTAALLRASRIHRITLNAILSAGLLAAIQRRFYPSPRVPLRHIVFSDMRPHLRSQVPASELGCHISMFRFTVMVETDGDLWSLARDIQESTLRAAHSGERFLSYSMSPAMMKAIVRMKAFRMAATALSYTGPLDLAQSWGSFAVTGLHAFTANFTLGPEYSALVRLFRGELWWDMLYLDSDMDAAKARQIAEDVQTILEKAACQSS